VFKKTFLFLPTSLAEKKTKVRQSRLFAIQGETVLCVHFARKAAIVLSLNLQEKLRLFFLCILQQT